MERAFAAGDLSEWLAALSSPAVWPEALALAACLAIAWLIARQVRGPQPHPDSVWFGHGVAGGVLFPALALLLAVGTRWGLASRVPSDALFRLAVPVLLSLLVIRVVVHVLARAFPQSDAMRAVGRSVSWLAWITVVLWMTGVLPVLLSELDKVQWKVGSTRISLRNLLEGTLTAVVVLVISLWVSSALEARLLRGATDNLSARKIAANALRAVFLFVGLMFALSAAGIDLTALGVLGGAVGVGLGFGLQKLAANYVSGFVILAERSMRIGDVVKIDDFEGRITDIKTRYTLIRANNGREAIVPNEVLITQRVENSTYADRRVLVTTTVQVAYGTDLALEPRLLEAIRAVPRVIAEPAPQMQLTAFAPDGMDLTLPFWIEDPENGQGNVRSEVNRAVLRTLNEMGVEIPYPQRVLHRARSGAG